MSPLKTVSGIVQTSGRRADVFRIEPISGGNSFALPTLIECNEILNNRAEIPTPEVAMQHPHLRSIASQIPHLDPNTHILLLLGRDVLRAHKVRQHINGPNDAPFAQKLDLGWVLVGGMCLRNAHKPNVYSAKTNVLENGRPSLFTPYPSHIQIKESSHTLKSYNGMERSSVSQRLPKCDSYFSQPPGPLTGPTSDYCHPVTQRLEVASLGFFHDRTSPLNVVASLGRVGSASCAWYIVCGHNTSKGVSFWSSSAFTSTPSCFIPCDPISTRPVVSSALSPSAPRRLSSPPLVVQGLKSSPVFWTQTSPTRSTHPSVVSPPLQCVASPPKSSIPPLLMEKSSQPSTISHRLTTLSSVTSSMHSPSFYFFI